MTDQHAPDYDPFAETPIADVEPDRTYRGCLYALIAGIAFWATTGYLIWLLA